MCYNSMTISYLVPTLLPKNDVTPALKCTVGMNFSAFIPIQFKTNAILTLLYRCYHLCSNWNFIHIELDFLTTYFQNNKFPLHLIQNKIRSFLNKILFPNPNTTTEKPTFHYISLPYYGLSSYDTRKKLNKTLKHCFHKNSFQVYIYQS